MSALYADEGKLIDATVGYYSDTVKVSLVFGSLAHGIGYDARNLDPVEIHEGSALPVTDRFKYEWHDMWHGSGRKFCLLGGKHWCDLEDAADDN